MSKLKNDCLVVVPPTTVVKETLGNNAVPTGKTIDEVSHEELSDELKNAGISPASDPIINPENAPEHSEEVIPPVLHDLIINEKIKDRIPELTAEEYMLLEKSILVDGCRDALIVWEGKNTLVDGHNRNAICKKSNIPFNVINKQFKDIEEVLEWVDDNQLGKRNLTIDQKAIIIGRRYNNEKKNSKDNLKQNLSKGQNVPSINVAEKFAKEYHINEKTIKRYGKKASEYEKIEAKNPFVAKNIFQGITKFRDVKEPTENKPAIPLKKKATEQPSPAGNTTKKLGTGADSKDIVIPPETDKNAKLVMTRIKKAKEKVIELQNKMKVISTEVTKVHRKTLGNNDDVELKRLAEEIRNLGIKKDGYRLEIKTILNGLGYLLVFDTKYLKTTMSGYEGEVKL